jgi:hypothetical protein
MEEYMAPLLTRRMFAGRWVGACNDREESKAVEYGKTKPEADWNHQPKIAKGW